MTLVLCAPLDLRLDPPKFAPVDYDALTETQAQGIVQDVVSWFRLWLDGRSCWDLYPYSQRALNIMRRYEIHTVSDLAEGLVKARSGQIAGAGALVQREWTRALLLARQGRTGL